MKYRFRFLTFFLPCIWIILTDETFGQSRRPPELREPYINNAVYIDVPSWLHGYNLGYIVANEEILIIGISAAYHKSSEEYIDDYGDKREIQKSVVAFTSTYGIIINGSSLHGWALLLNPSINILSNGTESSALHIDYSIGLGLARYWSLKSLFIGAEIGAQYCLSRRGQSGDSLTNPYLISSDSKGLSANLKILAGFTW